MPKVGLAIAMSNAGLFNVLTQASEALTDIMGIKAEEIVKVTFLLLKQGLSNKTRDVYYERNGVPAYMKILHKLFSLFFKSPEKELKPQSIWLHQRKLRMYVVNILLIKN